MYKKNKNRNGGFTLVELIIVMAIIAILAAVLVPAMLAYFRSARLDTANANAKYIYNTVNTYSQKCINYGARLPEGTYPSSGWLEIGNPGSGTHVAEVPAHMFEGSYANVGAAESYIEKAVSYAAESDDYGSCYQIKINSNGAVVAVVWAKNSGDAYVGGYPKPAKNSNWSLTDAEG